MNKRKETAAKILTLLDGLGVETDKEARLSTVEKLLGALTNEISARQAEKFALAAKLCDTRTKQVLSNLQ